MNSRFAVVAAPLVAIAIPLSAGCSVVGCSAPVERGGVEGAETSQAPIVGGMPASAYPEAALDDGSFEGCSGAIIAPRVFLTAGHCVADQTRFQVLAPYNRGGQMVNASSSAVFDWTAGYMVLDRSQHDIGLVFLDTPIKIADKDCPVLAQKPVKNNTKVVNLGRVQDGTVSSSYMYVGAATPVQLSGPSDSYPFDYTAQEYIQHGDSGGPVEVPGSSPHLIVAVNSGDDGMGTEFLARVDLVYDWIQSQIQSHGGPCTPLVDAGAGGTDGGGGAVADPEAGSGGDAGGNPDQIPASRSGGGCSVVEGAAPPFEGFALLAFGAITLGAARRGRERER